MFAGMMQLCDIKRPAQTKTSGKKDTTESTIATNMDCDIQPLSDTAVIAAMGVGATEVYFGIFPPEADLQYGDRVFLHEETGTDVVFTVRGHLPYRSHSFDLPHVVQVVLNRTKIP